MSPAPDRYGTAIFGVAVYARALPGVTKMKQQLRVLMDFVSMPDSELQDFTDSVLSRMTGNAAFPTPPVALTLVATQNTTFSDALAVHADGGKAATSAKNDARAVLVDSLRQNALYVQTMSDNNLTTLLSSGYHAASTSHAQQPLDKPQIITLTNGNTGQLLLRVKTVTNARSYEVRYAVIGAGGSPGPWQSAGVFTNSRSMPIDDLTPGTMYTVEVRAVGGSTGYSDWSDPSSHMSL